MSRYRSINGYDMRLTPNYIVAHRALKAYYHLIGFFGVEPEALEFSSDYPKFENVSCGEKVGSVSRKPVKHA
jgi:hypothetical protein